MKADTLTLKALFQKEVRYVIPTFQRPYVWTQEDQWEALWDDLRNVAEWYLDELEAAEGNSVLAEERAKSHFMGAVVLQQRPTPTAEIETRTVIDGQQRLTTMQLLLDAAQEVMEELELPEAPRLERLVVNEHAAGDEVFKLWPASLDQTRLQSLDDQRFGHLGGPGGLLDRAGARLLPPPDPRVDRVGADLPTSKGAGRMGSRRLCSVFWLWSSSISAPRTTRS